MFTKQTQRLLEQIWRNLKQEAVKYDGKPRKHERIMNFLGNSDAHAPVLLNQRKGLPYWDRETPAYWASVRCAGRKCAGRYRLGRAAQPLELRKKLSGKWTKY